MNSFSIFAIVASVLVVIAPIDTVSAASDIVETRSEYSDQRLQIGLFGSIDIDEGERNLLIQSAVDWVVWERLIVHAGFAFEERIGSFLKADTAFGAGWLFAYERSTFPVWAGPGWTTTGLWGHELTRSHLKVGLGYRYHVSSRLGLGINHELFFYGSERTRSTTQFGVVLVIPK